MEFFEKAHIMKNNDLKSKKTNEIVKKQLRQILYGYKISDNKIIQSSDNIKNDFDESASLSGFSDFNFTNSSQEDKIIPPAIDHDGNSFTGLGESLASSNVPFGDLNEEGNLNKNSNCGSVEDIDSLPEDVIDDEEPSVSDISVESDMLESLSNSEKSEVFDEDGNLAAEIIKKLEVACNKKRKCKRKYHELVNDINKLNDGKMFAVIENKNDVNEDLVPSSEEQYTSSLNSVEIETDIGLETDSESPAFVSITATDMPNQKLNEIIGEYKYSTVRNFPSETQNRLFSSNSGIFIEESMNVEIQTEDEVCSIIPEVDNIPTIEEIDKELVNLDTTTGTQIDESTINLDSTLVSDVISDTELSIIEDGVNLEETYKLYYVQNCCIIVMKHPSELFIQGKVKIKALGGSVEIFGYTLKYENYTIYAPYYNFSQNIKTVDNFKAYYGLFGKLTSAGLTVREAEEIVTTTGDRDAVVMLQTVDEAAMDFIDNNFKVTNLFVKSNKIIEPYFKKAADILNCSLFSTRPRKSFEEHPAWKEANVYAQNKQSRGIVCGGKSAGKSTYLRYQVNKLLSNGPVLVVDLDPGQCEFTVAGNISATIVTTPLFGPSFTHLRKPEIMLNIGMINTMDHTKRYVAAVRSLITRCSNNEALVNMPWIINTMGMTNVLGLKFITLIILLSKPTFLLQYESKNSKKRFDLFLRSYNVKLLYEKYRRDHLFANVSCCNDMNYSFILANDTEISVNNKFTLRPKDERYLNFLTYFSQLINIEVSLLGIVPYEVSLNDLYIGTNVVIKEDCVTKVINGKVVALCQHTRQCDSATAKVFTLSDKPLWCHGHGLIRGIDWEKDILYVITPVPNHELGSVNTLLYADWVPELIGQESQLPKGTVIPYRMTTQEQHKQLMSTPRRRFNPLQLLKMARNS